MSTLIMCLISVAREMLGDSAPSKAHVVVCLPEVEAVSCSLNSIITY